MPELNVPRSGLLLENLNSHSLSDLPPQTLLFTLNHTAVQDMIKHAQSGGELELSLGSNPALFCGSRPFLIPPLNDPIDQLDLFLTRPYVRTRLAQLLPNTMAILKPLKPFTTPKRPRVVSETAKSDKPARPNLAKFPVEDVKSEYETHMDKLKSSMAAAEAAKVQTMTMARIDVPQTRTNPVKKAPAKKSKLRSEVGIPSFSRKLLPPSPASRPNPPSQQPSPALLPQLSIAQQNVERLRKERAMLVHECSVEERSRQYLYSRWEGDDEDFSNLLKKTTKFNPATDKYSIANPQLWRELDPWVYEYATGEQRQTAIDNAVRHYDRLRLGVREPEWQILLPPKERGQGKWLSVVQQKVVSTRPGSQYSVPVEDVPEIPATAKKAPTSKQPAAMAKEKGAKLPPLSAEYVVNSDSSEEAPPTDASGSGSASTAAKSRGPSRPVLLASRLGGASKRRRPDDGPSGRPACGDKSSSNTPPTKRVKSLRSTTMAEVRSRPTTPTQSLRISRVEGTVFVTEASKTTAIKSSPLSSPPTNASDIERQRAQSKARSMKRPVKRPAVAMPFKLVAKAQEFRAFYKEYEMLHHRISAMTETPSDQLLGDLEGMHNQLAGMKREIYQECAAL